MSLENDVLQRIHARRIRPIPRTFAMAAHLAWAAAIVLALALSALSIALFLLLVTQGVAPGPHRGFRWIALGALPWIAGGTGLLLSWLGWRLFRLSPAGYRHRTWSVVAAFLALSTGSGIALHAGDVVFSAHRAMAGALPAYRNIFLARRGLAWHHPDRGMLAGTVLASTDSTIALRDPSGEIWQVRLAAGVQGASPQPGMPVRVQGARTGTNTFLAHAIRPLGPHGRGIPGSGLRGLSSPAFAPPSR